MMRASIAVVLGLLLASCSASPFTTRSWGLRSHIGEVVALRGTVGYGKFGSGIPVGDDVVYFEPKGETDDLDGKFVVVRGKLRRVEARKGVTDDDGWVSAGIPEHFVLDGAEVIEKP